MRVRHTVLLLQSRLQHACVLQVGCHFEPLCNEIASRSPVLLPKCNAKLAGAWSLSQAAALTWAEGDNWHTTVDLPSGSLVEYKYVVLDGSGQAVAWQSGNNSVLAVKHSEDELEVFDSW